MPNSYELSPDQLFSATDPATLPFDTTDDLESLNEIIGQQRAISAIELSIEVNKSGFNLFALGPAGIGKQSTIMQYLTRRAESQATPDDWCYVNNFDNPQKPHALRLPAGKGQELCRDMKKLVDDTKTSMPVAFEAENYQKQLQQIQEKYEQQRAEAFSKLSEEASADNITLIRGPQGFVLAPIVNGKAIDHKEFIKLAQQEQQRINGLIEQYEDRLNSLLQKMPQLAREERTEIRKLVWDTATRTVESLVTSLLEKYRDLPDVCRYLTNVKHDIAKTSTILSSSRPLPSCSNWPEGMHPSSANTTSTC
ncbi:MAG: Lon-like protease helical domain-containing protein [Gammaproteobacteria bacterium]|jgi:hypothetical protein